MRFAFVQLRIGKLSTLPRRFEKWWLAEFLDLFPERVVEFIAGRQQMSLVLRSRDETVTLELLSGSRASIGSAGVKFRSPAGTRSSGVPRLMPLLSPVL